MIERNAGIVVEVDRVLREEGEEVAPVLALLDLDVSIAMNGHLRLSSVHDQNQPQRRKIFVKVKRIKEERSKCRDLATTLHIVR